MSSGHLLAHRLVNRQEDSQLMSTTTGTSTGKMITAGFLPNLACYVSSASREEWDWFLLGDCIPGQDISLSDYQPILLIERPL